MFRKKEKIFYRKCYTVLQTDEFREWILECGAGQHENDFFAIFVDLTQNPLGIKGTDCFTLTYTFMAQVCYSNKYTCALQ